MERPNSVTIEDKGMSQVELSIPDISLRDVLRVLFKHKWPILGLYSVIVLASATACFFWPPTYAAAVRFLVTNTREEPLISSDQNSIRTLTKLTVTEDDLNSEMSIIQSPAVLEKTAKDMKIDSYPEFWLIRLLNTPLVYLRQVYDSYHSKPDPSPFVKGVQRLARGLNVTPETRSDIIEVTLRWGDPEFAQSALDRLQENYLAQHLLVHKSLGTQDLFLAQVNLKKTELADIERRIEAIRPGGNTDALNMERELTLKEASDFGAEWRKARAVAEQDKARVESQSVKLRDVPGRILTADKSVVNQQAIGTLRSEILQLELKRTELLQKYQPQNRLVVQVEEELTQANSMLEEELRNTPHEQTTDINEVAQVLQKGQSVSQTDLQADLALQEAMRKEYSEYEDRIRQLDRQALLIQELDREKRAVEASLILYQKEYEQARMQDEMNRTRVINVVPISPVSVDLDPVKPRASLLMELALGLGLIVSIGFGFLLEMLDHRLKSDSDAEAHLGIPVLATLDRYDSEEIQLAPFA
jgi:uncharacterized protein involved in exopolysaccharide biosynthesis